MSLLSFNDSVDRQTQVVEKELAYGQWKIEHGVDKHIRM